MRLSEQYTRAEMRACTHDWERGNYGGWICTKCGALGSTIYFRANDKPSSIRMDKGQDCADAPHVLARRTP